MPIPEEQIGPDTIFKSVSITIKFTNSESFRQKKAINIGSIYNILLSILCDEIQSQIWRVSFVAFWLTALYYCTGCNWQERLSVCINTIDSSYVYSSVQCGIKNSIQPQIRREDAGRHKQTRHVPAFISVIWLWTHEDHQSTNHWESSRRLRRDEKWMKELENFPLFTAFRPAEALYHVLTEVKRVKKSRFKNTRLQHESRHTQNKGKNGDVPPCPLLHGLHSIVSHVNQTSQQLVAPQDSAAVREEKDEFSD